MKMLSDEQKYKQLEKIIKEGTGRELKGEEEAFLNWLCAWDLPTFEAFKGILESMKK